MKIVFYLLTIIFGCLGILGVFRTIELLATGNAISTYADYFSNNRFYPCNILLKKISREIINKNFI